MPKKTQIFSSYHDFLDRPNSEVNGVSADFAASSPDYEIQNESNKGCWNSSDCSDCSRCSRCSDCSDCSDCSRCSGCSDCSDCFGCSDCFDCRNIALMDKSKNTHPPKSTGPAKSWFDVPVIANIHRTVLDASKKPEALNMRTWHTCETTHCRAGWVVTLAGEKGRALELSSGTLFAAMQIYKSSSPVRVSPVRFFETNEIAMADMERCANEEAALQLNTHN